MQISTKGRYALSIMLDLAVNYQDGYIPLRAIAHRQGISNKYAERIASLLNKAGYIHSSRGAQGGYCLSNPPKYYTVKMILQTMEGSLAPVACIKTHANPCQKASDCVMLEVWQAMKLAIEEVAEQFTLADLVTRHQGKCCGQF